MTSVNPLPMAHRIIEITIPVYGLGNTMGKTAILARPKNVTDCDNTDKILYPILSTNFTDATSIIVCVMKFIVISTESLSRVISNLLLKITKSNGAKLFITA